MPHSSMRRRTANRSRGREFSDRTRSGPGKDIAFQASAELTQSRIVELGSSHDDASSIGRESSLMSARCGRLLKSVTHFNVHQSFELYLEDELQT